MQVQTAHAAPGSQFEPCGVETKLAVNREPTTPEDWKRLAHSLEPKRPEDFPQMDAALFAEFKRDVIKYAGGRDVWPWLVVGLAVALISWLLAPVVVGSDASFFVGILMTIIAIAIPVLAGVAHRNLRSQAIAIGWSIGFFKLP
jgi:hypothetical protein